MSWSPERKQQHRDAMRRTAESSRCPECRRGSAVVTRRSESGRSFPVCRWVDKGKCSFAPSSQFENNPFKPS